MDRSFLSACYVHFLVTLTVISLATIPIHLMQMSSNIVVFSKTSLKFNFFGFWCFSFWQQIVKLSYVIEIVLTVLKQKFVQVLVCPGGPPAIENRKCKQQHHQHNHIYFTHIRHYREQHHQHNHIYLLTLDVTK
jgi:hypothetical protein